MSRIAFINFAGQNLKKNIFSKKSYLLRILLYVEWAKGDSEQLEKAASLAFPATKASGARVVVKKRGAPRLRTVNVSQPVISLAV